MYALYVMIAGLFVAHVIWLLFYAAGCIVLTNQDDLEQPRALLAVAVTTAFGAALWGFEIFILGSIHLLDANGIALCVVANLIALWLKQRQKANGLWWRQQARLFCSAFSWTPGLIVYASLLLLSTHAAFPDYTSDGVRYYLPVAYEWFRHGRIISDLRFRFPYYAQDHELLYAGLFSAGVGRYINFLNWLFGMLSVLISCGLIAAIDWNAQVGRTRAMRNAASIIYVAVPIAMALSPVFLRWHDTAMLDTALGFYYVSACAAAALALLTKRAQYLWAALITGAFLIGAKPSFLLFIPLYLLVAVYVGRAIKIRWQIIGMMLAVFCILASPWYVRNTIKDGEPVPPILNLYLHGKDVAFDREDWAGQRSDLRTSVSATGIFKFPYRYFFEAGSADFREYGATAVIFGLYVVALVLPLLIFSRRRDEASRAMITVLAITLAALFYYFATSTLARYFLLVGPACAAAIGISLLYIGRRNGPLLYSLAILSLGGAFPTPTREAMNFYSDYRDINYRGIASVMPSDDALLERNLPAYAEAEALYAYTQRWRRPHNVYLEQADLGYYIETHGGMPLGDWVGPWRYRDLATAIDDNDLSSYVEKNDVHGFILATVANVWSPDEIKSLEQQAKRIGFRQLSSSQYYVVYVRRDQRQ